MYYQIVKMGKQFITALEAYSSLESAEEKIAKHYSNKNVKIVLIPDKEIKAGMILHKSEEDYGEIVRGSDHFWIVKRYKDGEEVLFLKDTFEDKYINEVFIFKRGKSQ